MKSVIKLQAATSKTTWTNQIHDPTVWSFLLNWSFFLIKSGIICYFKFNHFGSYLQSGVQAGI